jgi:hypothetical protein
MAGAEDEMTRTAAEPNEPNAILLNRRELRNDYGAGEGAFRRGRRVTFTGRTVSFGGDRVIGAGRAEVFRPTAEGVEPGGRWFAFYKTNPIRLADRSGPKLSLRLAEQAPNEPNAAIAFCKRNPIRLADQSGPKPNLRLADEAPNKPNAAIAFCKTNPIRLADQSGPKPNLRLAEEAPNEPKGRMRRKAGARLLARAPRKRARRHCDTPEWQGTVGLGASLRLNRPYFIDAGVNRVAETVR